MVEIRQKYSSDTDFGLASGSGTKLLKNPQPDQTRFNLIESDITVKYQLKAKI